MHAGTIKLDTGNRFSNCCRQTKNVNAAATPANAIPAAAPTQRFLSEDVKKILVCAQKFFPCEYSLAGVVRVNPQGSVEEWCHLLNINYPSDWMYEYSKNGYTEVDPVLTAYTKSYETQVWKDTYKKSASKKQNEFH